MNSGWYLDDLEAKSRGSPDDRITQEEIIVAILQNTSLKEFHFDNAELYI